MADEVHYEDWEQKVLKNFLKGDQLRQIPARHQKRLVIFKWVANKFDEGQQYLEVQVNEIIKQCHPDSAILRREFVVNNFMTRTWGIYQRVFKSE